MNAQTVSISLFICISIVALFLAPVAGQPLDTDSSSVTGSNTPSNVSIANEVKETNGEQTVVVRLTDRPTPAIKTSSHDTPADALQAHAADTQSAFERFAAGNPHVSIDRRLWLTNALVVTVDTDRITLARLGMINHVERIHENYRISVNSATPASQPTSTPALSTAMQSWHRTSITQPPVSVIKSTTVTTNSGTAATTTSTERQFTNALKLIDVPTAWEEFENRGDGVRVAVLDTGVNPNHPDIDIRKKNWKCYTDCRTEGPHDVEGHGTHVSGTVVGGNSNDANLQIGVAPNATLMHAKVMNDTGNGRYGDFVAGMEWAVSNNADVISASLGDPGYNDAFIDPVRNAQSNGVMVVAAVGNGGNRTSSSPGNVYDATAVGSVDVEPGFPANWEFDLTDDRVSRFSGSEKIDSADWKETYNDTPDDWPDSYIVPDLTAPGNVIWSADANIDTATQCNGLTPDSTDLACLDGTSMATPHVAGVVALMESNSDINHSPRELQTTLKSTAVDIGESETRQGAGRIDADSAVSAVARQTNITPNITSAPTRVTAGRGLIVEYTAINRGVESGSTTLKLQINNTVAETTETGVLSPGEQTTGTLSYTTGKNDIGLRRISVSSFDDTDSQHIRIVEPQVQLTNLNVSSTQVNESVNTYTLNMTVLNVSDDDQPDSITIKVPDQIAVDNVETTTAVDSAGKSIAVANATVTAADEITIIISPNSDATLRDLSITTGFNGRV